jgi:hypothetical protein
MLFDWLFATLAFALAGWVGMKYFGGDPELWLRVFLIAVAAFAAGHWNGHCLGRLDPDRLDRDFRAWQAREHWRG